MKPSEEFKLKSRVESLQLAGAFTVLLILTLAIAVFAYVSPRIDKLEKRIEQLESNHITTEEV